MSDGKSIKRGEKLFEENKSPQALYVVTSGKLSHYVVRSGKKIEIGQSQGSPVYGDEALFSTGKHVYTAEAVGTVQYSEIPIETFKQILDKLPSAIKVFFKSLVEEVRVLRNAIKSTKLEQESMPCPQPNIARVFGGIHLVSRHIGKKRDDGCWEIGWEPLKLYTTRFFLEKHNRIQSALEILTKLGYVELKMQKNEDGIDELNSIIFKNLDYVEQFAEFYQYYFYKPGKQEVQYYDKMAFQIVKNLLEVSKNEKPDHKGYIRLDYDKMLKDMKEQNGFEFKADHIRVLEHKGLNAARKSTEKNVQFLFDRIEFERLLRHWAVIHEIDKWNETGKVVMVEEVAKEDLASRCPSCRGEVVAGHKFCPGCGFKLAA